MRERRIRYVFYIYISHLLSQQKLYTVVYTASDHYDCMQCIGQTKWCRTEEKGLQQHHLWWSSIDRTSKDRLKWWNLVVALCAKNKSIVSGRCARCPRTYSFIWWLPDVSSLCSSQWHMEAVFTADRQNFRKDAFLSACSFSVNCLRIGLTPNGFHLNLL